VHKLLWIVEVSECLSIHNNQRAWDDYHQTWSYLMRIEMPSFFVHIERCYENFHPSNEEGFWNHWANEGFGMVTLCYVIGRSLTKQRPKVMGCDLLHTWQPIIASGFSQGMVMISRATIALHFKRGDTFLNIIMKKKGCKMHDGHAMIFASF
jgi:hypothetical protein